MSRIFLSARWEHLIMANYAVDTESLKPYLPAGVELDEFHGKTYVSLVGFMFRNIRLFGVPIPFFGSFEEINLRFYVKRQTPEGLRRGVVFINETVPYRPVAWLANKLYKEHYTAVPTKHLIKDQAETLSVQYAWKRHKRWHRLSVEAEHRSRHMEPGSAEEFIFEHYFGYTRISETATEEYRVQHPRWNIRPVLKYALDCDFADMYGPAFGFLNKQQPDYVMLAEGSPVQVLWKRNRI